MMTKASILVLFIALLFCLQSRCEDSSLRSNGTNLSSTSCDLSQPKQTMMISKGFTWAFWVILVAVGFFCSGLVIHAVVANPHMHTTTNYLIVNMAVGDTLATLMTAITALFILVNSWNGGDNIWSSIFCKTSYCSLYTFMLCSVLSLVGITFDRFLAVIRPLKHNNHSSWIKCAIPIIWLASIAIPSNYVINKVKLCPLGANKVYCLAHSSEFDGILIFSIGFALPHVVMVILYMVIAYKLCTRRVPGEHAHDARANTAARKVAKKVTCMIICILVAFEVSWCPFFFGYILPYLLFEEDVTTYAQLFGYKALMSSNGISNFMIYAFFNQNFRRAFKETLRSGSKKKCPGKVQVNDMSTKMSDDHILSQRDKTSTTTIPTCTDKTA